MKRMGMVLGVGLAGVLVANTVINAYLPTHLAAQGVSNTLIGFILTWDNYLAFITVGLIGWLSDRTWTRLGRRRPWLLGAAPVAALMLLAVPLAPGIPALLAVLFVLNLSLAAIRVPGQALLADRVPPKQHNLVNSIGSTVGCIVVIIGYLASGAAATQGGLMGAMVVSAAAVMILAVPPLFVREQREVASHTASAVRQAAPIWMLVRRDPAVRWSLIGLFGAMLGLGAVEAWIPDLAQRSLNLAPDALANVLAAATLTLVVGSIPAGLAAQRWGARRVLRLGIGGLAVAYAISAVLVRDARSLTVFMAVVGILSAMVYTTALPVLYKLFPLEQRNIGMVTGIYFVIYNGAYAVGPQLAGVLIDATGQHTNVLALAAVGAMVSSVAWLAADYRYRRQVVALPVVPPPLPAAVPEEQA